jgi:chromosome segregation ATPase
LAAGLSNSESESEKTALLNKVEERTEEKGKPLTEAELKAIRAEIESEYRNKQEDLFEQLQAANRQVDDAKYLMEIIDRENAVLKLEASNAKKFKQQYEETYQQKRLTENHLRSTTKKLEETSRQLERFQKELKNEKDNAVKEYINKHLGELEQQKIDIEQEISKKQAEINRKNTELETLKHTLNIENDKKYREVMLRKMLVSFSEFTTELSQNQVDLLNAPFADHLAEYKGIINQLKTWVEILEEAIYPLENKQTIEIKKEKS